MKHVITTKVETSKEIDVITPSYFKNDGIYYKFTEDNGTLYVIRLCVYDRYQSLIKTTTITPDCFGEEITAEEFTTEFTKCLNRLAL